MDGMADAVPSIFRLTPECLFRISIGAKKFDLPNQQPVVPQPDFLNCPTVERAAPQAARGWVNVLADS